MYIKGKKFSKGEKAILDIKFRNSSEIEIVRQSPNRLFTTVKYKSYEWDTMTSRLTKIKDI